MVLTLEAKMVKKGQTAGILDTKKILCITNT